MSRSVSRRVLRVAELLDADPTEVSRHASRLPAKFSAAIAQVPAGTLLTIELYRRPWDRLPRRWVLGRLHRSLTAIQHDTEQLRVVAAALIDADRVLVAQRSHPPELAGRWEFPGGKVERGETAELALRRECAEELGVQIVVGNEIARRPIAGELARRQLILFQVELLAGSPAPRALEHQQLRWASATELAELDWVGSNAEFCADVTARLSKSATVAPQRAKGVRAAHPDNA